MAMAPEGLAAVIYDGMEPAGLAEAIYAEMEAAYEGLDATDESGNAVAKEETMKYLTVFAAGIVKYVKSTIDGNAEGIIEYLKEKMDVLPGDFTVGEGGGNVSGRGKVE